MKISSVFNKWWVIEYENGKKKSIPFNVFSPGKGLLQTKQHVQKGKYYLFISIDCT